jgi:nucleotide-binding universal stress UspA family protein
MFKRTVVGCKDSGEGRDAVALGATIALATDAGPSLVCAYPTSIFPVPGSSDRATFLAQAEATLRRERDSQGPQALIDAVPDPFVARALRHYAARWHAGLVVVGSDASAPAGQAAIGRRSRQLLYDAPFTPQKLPFSLALARRGFHEQSVELRRIGVGYDCGPEAQAALAFAAELGRATGSTLAIHSVIEDRVPVFTAEKWIGSKDLGEMWEGRRQSAQTEAEEAASLLDIPTEVTGAVGDPGLQMRDLSERVDLLVVGSRRWGPVARLVSGSVGETLVSEAHCSIMIVPRPPVARGPHTRSLIAAQTPA